MQTVIFATCLILSHATQTVYDMKSHTASDCSDSGSVVATIVATVLSGGIFCSNVSGSIQKTVSSCKLAATSQLVFENFACTDYPTCKTCQTTKTRNTTYTYDNWAKASNGECHQLSSVPTGGTSSNSISKYSKKTGWANPCTPFNAARSSGGQCWFQVVVLSGFSATLLLFW